MRAAVERAARAALEASAARRAQANPLRWITPPGCPTPRLFTWTPKQREALDKLWTPHPKLALFGAGNRVGKTEWAVRCVLGAALGLEPETLHEQQGDPGTWQLGPARLVWCVTTTFEKSREVQQRYVWERTPPALRRSRYHPSSGFHNGIFLLANGSRLVFKTEEQKLSTFEGNPIHGAWIDEFVDLSYVLATLVRTTDYRGWVLWTTWPNAPELEDIFVQRRMYPGMTELLSERDVAAVWGGMADNPYLSPEEIALQSKLLSPQERAARILGRFAFRERLVYADYGDLHRETVDFPVPATWTRWELIDPGWDNPCCVLFGGVDSAGVLHAYDEIYRRHRTVGEIAAEIYLRRWTHAGLMTPAEITQYRALIEGPSETLESQEEQFRRNQALLAIVQSWRAVKGEHPPQRCLIDEAAQQRDQAKPVNVREQFRAFGIVATPASNRDKEGQRNLVRRRLRPLDGRIGLLVSQHCGYLDWELRHYKTVETPDGEHPDDKEKAGRTHNHAIVCVEYWCAADPRWVPPEERPAPPGSELARHQEIQARKQRAAGWRRKG